jgi:hypothetical protein
MVAGTPAHPDSTYFAEAMSQFGHHDGFDTVSLITGPSHVFLGIRFGDGQPRLFKRPPIGSCEHGELDEARILEAVRAGLTKANAECGSSTSAAAILYVASDSPRYDLYERCAYLLASRCARPGGTAG